MIDPGGDKNWDFKQPQHLRAKNESYLEGTTGYPFPAYPCNFL